MYIGTLPMVQYMYDVPRMERSETEAAHIILTWIPFPLT